MISTIPALGELPMPPGFPYRDTFLKGKPRHDRCDPFRARHPEMEHGRRAKIFAPFDALRGFSDRLGEAAASHLMREGSLRSRPEAEEWPGDQP